MAGKMKNPDYTQADMDVVSDNPEWTAEDFCQRAALCRGISRHHGGA